MTAVAKLVLVAISALGCGCAAPITYYSESPQESKTGMVQFIAQSGPYTSFALYETPATCRGIQRVALGEQGVNKTVYVPNSAYLTFGVFIRFGGITEFDYGTTMYSVPFTSGAIRVSISYDAKSMYTTIERREAGSDWTVVNNAVARKADIPILESGSWCKSTPEIQ